MGKSIDRVASTLGRVTRRIESTASRVGSKFTHLYSTGAFSGGTALGGGAHGSTAAALGLSSFKRNSLKLMHSPVPAIKGVQYMGQVVATYTYSSTSSLLKTNKKCIMVVNGTELVLLRLPSRLSKAGKALVRSGSASAAPGHQEGDDSARVLAVLQLNTLVKLEPRGATGLSLEFSLLKSGDKVPPSWFTMFGTSVEELRELLAAAVVDGEADGDDPDLQDLLDGDPQGTGGSPCGQSPRGASPRPLHAASHAGNSSVHGGDVPAPTQHLLTCATTKGLAGPGSMGTSSSGHSPAAGATSMKHAATMQRAGSGQMPPAVAEERASLTQELIRLTFKSQADRDQASAALRAGEAVMREAIGWLRSGFPLGTEFELASITALEARATGPEALVCGPAAWGLELVLPEEWGAAIAAQTSEDQAAMRPLRLAGGCPAAYRVYVSTPSGLAVATLVPELVSRFLQQSSSACELLAIPVRLNLAETAAPAATWPGGGGSSAGATPARDAAPAGDGAPLSLVASRQGSGEPPAQGAQPGEGRPQLEVGVPLPSSGARNAQPLPSPLGRTSGGSSASLARPSPLGPPANGSAAAGAGPLSPQPLGRSGSPGLPPAAAHHSRSASIPPLLPGQAPRQGSVIELQRSGSLENVSRLQQSPALQSFIARSRSALALNALATGQSVAGSDAGGEEPGGPGSRPPSLVQGDPGQLAGSRAASAEPPPPSSSGRPDGEPPGLRVTFGGDLYALLQVRVVRSHTRVGSHRRVHFPSFSGLSRAGLPLGMEDGSPPRDMGPLHAAAAAGDSDAAAASGSSPAGLAVPVAARTGGGGGGYCVRLPGGRSHHLAPLAAGGLLAVVVALAATAVALLAAGRLMALLHLLLLVANAATLLVLLSPVAPASIQNTVGEVLEAVQHLPSMVPALLSPAGLRPRRLGGPVRLQLLGGTFVRDPYGQLQEQVLSCQRLFTGDEEKPAGGTGEVGDLAAADAALEAAAGAGASDGRALLSDPEPAWMTPDLKRRFIMARAPAWNESQHLARLHEAYRRASGVDTILSRPAPHFDWFQSQLGASFLGVSPQGHTVIRLRIAPLCCLSKPLKEAGLTPADLTAHFALLWTFMFTRLSPQPHPEGRFILLADMRGMRMAQALGSEGQAMGKALGTVMSANPERLAKTLVVAAPSWFNLMWKLVAPHLAESTRAKVQVLTDQRSACDELGRWLGLAAVPAEYGGPNASPPEAAEPQRQLLRAVRQLNSGGSDSSADGGRGGDGLGGLVNGDAAL